MLRAKAAALVLGVLRSVDDVSDEGIQVLRSRLLHHTHLFFGLGSMGLAAGPAFMPEEPRSSLSMVCTVPPYSERAARRAQPPRIQTYESTAIGTRLEGATASAGSKRLVS